MNDALPDQGNPVTRPVALITGAAQRIGKSIALDLGLDQLDGFDIAVHYLHSDEDADAVVNQIIDAGFHARAFQADLCHPDEARGLFRAVRDAMGPVQLLINNASLFEEDSWDSVNDESWSRHMEANLHAPFILMQEMAQNLAAHNNMAENSLDGAIINIIDQRVLNLNPFFTSYTIAKSALWSMTQTMSMALAPHIRVNAIGPGPTLANARQSDEDFESQWQALPLPAPVSCAEICAAIRYFVKAKAVTGQMLAVDGGEHLGWAQPDFAKIPKE